MEQLITKWRQFNKKKGQVEEIPITELSYDQLTKALKKNSDRLRPYKKLVNIDKALREEIERRKTAARKLAEEHMQEGAEVLMVMSEKDLLEKAEEIRQSIGDSKLVTMRFV